MKRFRSLVAVVLLAFWPVVSSHAWLQAFGLIHIAHAEHAFDRDGPDNPNDPHDADHDVADGRCLHSLRSVDIPTPSDVASSSCSLLGIVAWTTRLSLEPHPSGLAPPGLAPPELTQRWQFSFRTALHGRAPSFVS